MHCHRNSALAERPRRDRLPNDRAAAERLRLKIGPEGVVGATGFLRWATVGRRGGRARRQADAIVDSSSFGGDPIFIARRAACRYGDGVGAPDASASNWRARDYQIVNHVRAP
jgi:hypothetical protein